MKSLFYTTAAFALGTMAIPGYAKKISEKERPNVILILVDDHGYGDLGCLGNNYIHTPNIDNFSTDCIRFSNFHVGTTSAPTRSALLTGHYNNTTGVWHTIRARSILDREEYTLANAFQDNGYNTAMFGKWHLGDNHPYRPYERGFDESLYIGGGAISNAPDYWDNKNFDDTYFRNGVPEKQNGYCTDIWFKEAIDFITKHKDEPFFCYLPTNAVHGPWTVEEKYAAQYRNNPDVVSPTFCGMLTNVDENMGKLLKSLKELGIEDNTIVIYMSDNGTEWGGGCEVNDDQFVIQGYNAGMRGVKGSEYEGGHRVPCFMRIPGKTSKEIDALTANIDIMPTLADICNLKLPKGLEFDGTSLIPLITGKAFPDRILCVDTQRGPRLEKYRHSCVMQGRWRLINSKELYDLNIDPEQRVNIAEKFPKRVKNMKIAYELWWERNTVRAKDYQYIVIDPKAETNLLCGHDMYMEEKNIDPAWHQNSVRRGVKVNGEWKIEIEKEDDYMICLYRWDPSTNAALLDSLPKGKIVPNGGPAPAGVALPITGARIKIDSGKYLKSKLDKENNDKFIPFKVHLKPGQYSLAADFEFNDGESYASVYYVDMKIAKQSTY